MAPGPAKAGGRFKTSMMGIAGGGGGVSGEGGLQSYQRGGGEPDTSVILLSLISFIQ